MEDVGVYAATMKDTTATSFAALINRATSPKLPTYEEPTGGKGC